MKSFSAKLGIYSLNSYLADVLHEKFTKKSLKVTVFNTLIGVDYGEFDYLIFDLLGNYNKVSELQKILSLIECKTIVLFPRYVPLEKVDDYDEKIKNLLSSNSNVGVILTPEVIGRSVKFNENYISHPLIKQTVLGKGVKITSDAKLIDLISLKSLCEVIVKETFSFGISGQTLALGGYKRSQKGLLTNYLGVNEKDISYHNYANNLVELTRTDFRKVSFSLRLALKNTKKTFLDSIIKAPAPVQVVPAPVKTVQTVQTVITPPKVYKKRNLNLGFLKKFLKPLMFFLLILSTPFLILGISLMLLFLAYKFVHSDLDTAKNLVNTSNKTAEISRSISLGIPFYYRYSDFVVKSGELFLEGIELASLSSEFLSQVTSDQVYNATYYTDSISGAVEKIYTDSGFLQSDMDNLKINFLNSSFRDYREKILNTKQFFSRLSHLVGAKSKAKYLVLFQNNMELRPTGGFIGSFALLTLDKGKLSEIVVNDVYTADGQLKGHVDPPEPIRAHLGEGGWYLRDANWDPDFPESSKKIEWFLNKEIDETVDGVIAVDLSFVKKLLNITGPITLNDFDKTISADNFYANIQSEVEDNFFPGSIKKASFLTSLVKELINRLQDVSKDAYYPIFNAIYESLNERHVQVYLHDTNAQKAIEELGFGGNINIETDCGLRCYLSTYSLIDANLGVNKANQYIKRSHDLSVELKKETLSHELTVTYENIGSQSLGSSGVYKSYTRLIVPKEAKIAGVRLYDPFGGSEDLNFDTQDISGRKEIGFLINLLPKDIKRLKIVWNIDNTKLSEGGEYRLYIRKQAGTDDDKLKVNIRGIDLSLTKGMASVYTTDLNEDFSSNLFLIPNDN